MGWASWRYRGVPRGDGFTELDLCRYLRVATGDRFCRLLARAGMPRKRLYNKEEAARLIFEQRRAQGARLLARVRKSGSRSVRSSEH